MKKTLTITLLTTVALAASLIYAQEPGNGRPHDPAAMVQRHIQFLTNQLGLDQQQQQQATTIFTNAATSQASMHSSMKTAHDSLQTAIKNNDQNAISQAATNIGNLTSQSIANHAKAEAAFYQILRPDQQEKWSQLRSKWDGHGRGRRGFGPPPGGPGPGGPGF